MSGFAQPETPFPAPKAAVAGTGSGDGGPPSNGDFAEQELDAALQLLVERAQYITGATGAALALSQGEEMVCRASVGSSGPVVGARLQVRSGLSGESISRRQLLRCDNAETDPRVNLETCRELGIASIVVLPLLTRTGELRGIFELFSDHAYAFEERDLIALERMADLTMTALDLAERRPARGDGTLPSAGSGQALPELAVAPALVADPLVDEAAAAPSPDNSRNGAALPLPVPSSTVDALAMPEAGLDHPLGAAQVHSALFQEAVPEPAPASVPEAMRRVQKCGACGFPVSEGRTLCVDCENKRHTETESATPLAAESIPAFLDSSALAKPSWLSANYVNVLAAVVLVLSIVVAVVVFR